MPGVAEKLSEIFYQAHELVIWADALDGKGTSLVGNIGKDVAYFQRMTPKRLREIAKGIKHLVNDIRSHVEPQKEGE